MSHTLYTTAAMVSCTAVVLLSAQLFSRAESPRRPAVTLPSEAFSLALEAGHSQKRCRCLERRAEHQLRKALRREERLVTAFNDAGRLLLNRRTAFGVGHGTTVYGYPSTGGCYTLKCDAVELDYLGLSRSEPTLRSGDLEEEDAHCARMMKLGPNWWKSLTHYLVNQSFGDSTWEDAVVIAGYPAAGGLWLLKTTKAEAADAGAARIHNAKDMEERCQMIERCGGRFYEEIDEVPELVVRILGIY